MKKITPYLIALVLMAGCAKPTPENTARRYSEALLSGDFASFKALFDKERQKYLKEDTFRRLKPPKCVVESIAAPYATVRYRIPLDADWPEERATLYILPSGRIKYDPIFLVHPALALRGLLSQIANDDIRYRQSAFRTLTKWAIPTFGFDPTAELATQTNSIARFRHWVQENESTFDTGTVKIPASPVDRERLEKAAQDETELHRQWIVKVLQQCVTIRVGMTRQDLLKVFTTEGGISTRSQRTFVHKDCANIKVDVQFKPVGQEDQKLKELPEDQITAISRPYLQFAVSD